MSKKEIQHYKKNKDKKNYIEADKNLSRIIFGKNPTEVQKYALLEKANLNLLFLKKPKESIKAYKKLAQMAESEDLTNEYLLMAAGIYADNLYDYHAAIAELKLIDYEKAKVKVKIKSLLVKSYSKLKKNYQALIHLEEALEIDSLDKKNKFDFLLQKANLLLQTEKNVEAVSLYKNLKEKFPLKYKKEKLYMNLVVGLESLGQLSESIKELQLAKVDFPKRLKAIDSKIAKMKKLQSNQPGAEGLRR